MTKENKSVKKAIANRYNITMTESDEKNYEKLKEILNTKTKSGMFRQLLTFAINNPNAITKLNNPITKTDRTFEESISLLRQLDVKERDSNEKRFIDLETQNKEILNLVKKIFGLLAVKFPEESKVIKQEVNGLGGKF